MDTFRILMVLPSVFTRGWNPRRPILTQKSTPGGGSENPFFGVPGDPPHPPREGGRGGDPPRGGGRPAPRGGRPNPPFSGFRGPPPPPPGRGGGGGTPPEGGAAPPPGGYPPTPPRGGYPPLPGGGKPRPKRTPPWGTPNLCINL